MARYPILTGSVTLSGSTPGTIDIVTVDAAPFGVRSIQFASPTLDLDQVTVTVLVNSRTIIAEDVPASLFNSLAQQDLLGDILISERRELTLECTDTSATGGAVYAVVKGAHRPEASGQAPFLAYGSATVGAGSADIRLDLSAVKGATLKLRRFHVLTSQAMKELVFDLVIGTETVIQNGNAEALEALFDDQRLDLDAVIDDNAEAYFLLTNLGGSSADVDVLAELYHQR